MYIHNFFSFETQSTLYTITYAYIYTYIHTYTADLFSLLFAPSPPPRPFSSGVDNIVENEMGGGGGALYPSHPIYERVNKIFVK